MPVHEKRSHRVNDYNAVRIGLASPEMVRSWSCGEIKKPDTVNYRTFKPERDGLFCERIFGPEKDWQCSCGRYRGVRHRGLTCERCQVQVEHSRGRRHRMGHIDLAAPVVHTWFFRAAPRPLEALLNMKTASLEKIIYYEAYVVLKPGHGTGLEERQLLSEGEYRQLHEKHGNAFEAGMGAEAIEELLGRLDLAALSQELRTMLLAFSATGLDKPQRERSLIQRNKVVNALLHSGNHPEWMVLRCLPVIPPDLRPIVRLDTGNLATSDLNDLYRRILNRNNRLKKLLSLHAPEVILRNEKRLLQQSVDALFDNGRCKRPVLSSSNRPLRSLADMIKGKQGRFRENLLGKRVDYSARSVIVVGPELKLHQCGLPKKIALELYQPFIIRRLKELKHADTVRKAMDMIRRKEETVWKALEEVIKNHPVLLNRAPTLHRMGIQAFEPVLIEGNAIRIHPLVCKGFNADFDGDQMAVHLPLSVEAQVEARVLMMSTNNIFSPANGQPIVSPSQDIVMGCYYLTASRDEPEERVKSVRGVIFSNPSEVILAHSVGKVGVHDQIQVRLPFSKKVIREGVTLPASDRVLTTTGRVLFNDILPSQMAFYDLPMTSKNLSRLIADCHQMLGQRETIELLDRMKTLGFQEATRSGLSFAIDDLRTPASKQRILQTAEDQAEKIRKLYEKGRISQGERRQGVIEVWTEARDQVTQDMFHDLAHDRRGGVYLNPVHVMAKSGARGGREQITQLAGMRGLIARPSGEILETPVKSSFREGLSVLEYFSSTHGARKGLADMALKTAEAGHLMRKLADVAQNVVVTLHDCGTMQGIAKTADQDRGTGALAEVIRGRVSWHTHRAPDGTVVVRANELINAEQAHRLEAMGLQEVVVRSPLTCAARHGVCQLCYGADLSTGRLVEPGMAVGIIAAQSIGEPGTQLTLRNFHIGGVYSTHDITMGLPRVTELFEAYRPGDQRPAILAEITGRVRVGEPLPGRSRKRQVFIQPLDGAGQPFGMEHEQRMSIARSLVVKTGDHVETGDPLTDGPRLIQDLLRCCGLEAARKYLLREVQRAYRAQAVRIDDKHVEIIIARMLCRVKVMSAGDTELLPGAIVERSIGQEVNDRLRGYRKVRVPGDSVFSAGQVVSKDVLMEEAGRLKAEGKRPPTTTAPRPATFVPVLFGITRAALLSESFISAASFQETGKVLTEAALAGKVDDLSALKENVIVGRLVPAGTGFRR